MQTNCSYCDQRLTLLEFALAADGNSICMACVKARARAAVTRKCSCGKLRRRGELKQSIFNGRVMRQWQSCERCLASITVAQR